jgi:dienelactone hydrolase
MSKLIGRYDPPWSFSDGGITHSIYSAGAGVPVVVLHELPGMVEECLDLGLILSKHFRVHLPLLFGEPGQPPGSLRALLHICIRREIYLLAANKHGPLLDWVRALCRKLKAEANVPGIGVIGMCLTGGFALAMLADDSVLAPVVAQPSLPLLSKAALGLSEVDQQAVKERADRLGPGCVLGLRYAGDHIAPEERMCTIGDLIGDAFNYEPLRGVKRATLTLHRHPVALERTIAFLQHRLAVRGA